MALGDSPHTTPVENVDYLFHITIIRLSVKGIDGVMNLLGISCRCIVSGPKQLGVFGASYLFPVFLRLDIIREI